MNILEQIHSSADVKKLPREQLPALCAALREELIETISRTGGHLASNLGAVELTVALHRVYDSARDRIVFDVGHQCYAHKILTGRREQFHTLRQLGGLSGFPKPSEAVDDACIAGHASTSVSLALGMARARSMQAEDYDICAVIGDGALTGGLAYEALADCGASGEPIVVVLNDNAMSISQNVGGLARALEKARVRSSYLAFKKFYRRTIGRYEHVYRALHRVKEWIKDLLLPDNFFEDLGFYYLGPIDGHDLKTLTRTLRYAREQRIPVLLHVRTVKGKGYPPAEQNPAVYHGVAAFDPHTGVQAGERDDFSAAFGRAMCELAAENEKLVAITAAMTDGTGLADFAARYPKRFFDVGIAEEHAAALAAGMAKQGLQPVFAVYSSFLQRSFDQLIHDLALGRVPVVLAVDRAGLVGADGETHQGAFDVGYLGLVPGMKLFAPSNYAELRSALHLALQSAAPCALRYPRGAQGAFQEDTMAHAAVILRSGADVTIVTYGTLVNEALAAAQLLAQRGVQAEIVKLNVLDAPDMDLLRASVQKTGALLCAEESAARGGMGERILAAFSAAGVRCRSACCNLGSGAVPHGTVAQLRAMLHLDAAGIAAAAEDLKQ